LPARLLDLGATLESIGTRHWIKVLDFTPDSHSWGNDMSERLELFLQCLRAARPIAQKHPTLGDLVELIDDAIIEAESKLKAIRGSEARKH
jgi:prophage DNA circulation protein